MNKSNRRFSVEREVDLTTNTVVRLHLIDEVGELPRLTFTDPTELHEWETAFMKEWTALKNELRAYYRRFDCHTCHYHNYDSWGDDYEEFEVCDKGHNDDLDFPKHSCTEWEEL